MNRRRIPEHLIEFYKSKVEGIIVFRDVPIEESEDIPLEELDRDSLLAIIGYYRNQSWQKLSWPTLAPFGQPAVLAEDESAPGTIGNLDCYWGLL